MIESLGYGLAGIVLICVVVAWGIDKDREK